jgi:hypothetical protein
MAYKDPVTCPVCGRHTCLNMDDGIRQHDRPPLPGYGLARECPASGQILAEAARIGRALRGEATPEDKAEMDMRGTIEDAMYEADRGGIEGDGWDFRVFACALANAGWTYSPRGNS